MIDGQNQEMLQYILRIVDNHQGQHGCESH